MKERNITNVNFEDDKIENHLNNPYNENQVNIVKFLEILSVCHTVIVEEKKGRI